MVLLVKSTLKYNFFVLKSSVYNTIATRKFGLI
jgi:hypothetical protein